MSIIVMVDSAANMSRNILKKYNLTVLPYNLIFADGKCYKDVLEVKNQKELVQLIEQNNQIPKIERISNLELENCFRKYIDYGDDILYICVSSKLSNSYKEVSKVASKFHSSNIQVIDSLNIGNGEMLLALCAREYINKGYGLKQAVKYLSEKKKMIKSCYSVGDCNYFYTQNKCDTSQRYLGFSHIPVVEINEGKMFLTFSAKENEIAIQVLKNTIYDYSKKILPTHMVISYSGDRKNAALIKNYVIKLFPNILVEVVENSPIVFLNSGMNTIGIAFMLHEIKSYG